MIKLKFFLSISCFFSVEKIHLLIFGTLSPSFTNGFHWRNVPMLSFIYLQNRPVNMKFDILLVYLDLRPIFITFLVLTRFIISFDHQYLVQLKTLLVVVAIILPEVHLYFITDDRIQQKLHQDYCLYFIRSYLPTLSTKVGHF